MEETRHIEKQMLNIIKVAIEKEREAQERYAKGEKLAVIPEVRDLFRQLRQSEEGHERLLTNLYNKIEKKIKE